MAQGIHVFTNEQRTPDGEACVGIRLLESQLVEFKDTVVPAMVMTVDAARELGIALIEEAFKAEHLEQIDAEEEA